MVASLVGSQKGGFGKVFHQKNHLKMVFIFVEGVLWGVKAARTRCQR